MQSSAHIFEDFVKVEIFFFSIFLSFQNLSKLDHQLKSYCKYRNIPPQRSAWCAVVNSRFATYLHLHCTPLS